MPDTLTNLGFDVLQAHRQQATRQLTPKINTQIIAIESVTKLFIAKDPMLREFGGTSNTVH
ncbi:hypothetical protein [Mycobacterium lepromatosis]|uniref:hypothetical protein n=1 Tax=Mycobacterium lepromatosis TaxID=480418 RepID=UPI0006794487|nr:hypothetical protein [Mycobacterium lepromatosis]